MCILVDIVDKSVKLYCEEDSEKLRPVVRFECRGLQPLALSPRAGWRVVSDSDKGTTFDDVDLGEGVSNNFESKLQFPKECPLFNSTFITLGMD